MVPREEVAAALARSIWSEVAASPAVRALSIDQMAVVCANVAQAALEAVRQQLLAAAQPPQEPADDDPPEPDPIA